MVKVITYGTFDLLHYGHIRLLERAKALGDYLIVGITSDDYDKTRGKINNQQSLIERIAAVEATGIADEIIVEEYEGQKIDDIRRLEIDIFTVGSDWMGYFDYLNEYCKVVYLPRTEGVSSSEIRAERRKIRIGVIGDLEMGKRFAKEASYVNGIELCEVDEKMEDIDAVYVASLPSKHYEDVKYALEHGKHVLCESPITLNVSKYIELAKLAEGKGLILSEAIRTAYSTAYNRLILIAKSGRIGDVVSVDATCTSLKGGAGEDGAVLVDRQNSICAWAPTAMLPVFQILGNQIKRKTIISRFIDENLLFDAFTKIDFVYENAVASVKVAKASKSEGDLIITGTKGYIYVPAPWWKTDYFEVRFENQADNKRYFYQLDGDGIRYEIVSFVKEIKKGKQDYIISKDTTINIVKVLEDFHNRNYLKI